MIILGIETSCDETAAAVVQSTDKSINILSNVVASSLELQSKYGGVIPEQAAREQIKSIIPVIQEALHKSQKSIEDIDALAVTYGPGLIGSLLVGVETAKTLSLIWNKPLIPINHLLGHFYANWVEHRANTQQKAVDQSKNNSDMSTDTNPFVQSPPKFPLLGLLVSGGHSDLVLFRNHNDYEYLGGTRDDAAGECFDKCARILGLPYPGGPVVSKLAKQGRAERFKLPKLMTKDKDFDFSFSGLKTAVNLLVQNLGHKITSQETKDLCASIENTIVEVLVRKTLAAAKEYNIDQIIIAGGVAANQTLYETLLKQSKQSPSRVGIFVPPANLCTDNAVMIATAAFFNNFPVDPLKLQANPSLSLSNNRLT